MKNTGTDFWLVSRGIRNFFFCGEMEKEKMDIIHGNRTGRNLFQKKEKRIYNGNRMERTWDRG